MTLENVVVNLHLNAHTLSILPRIYQATSHSSTDKTDDKKYQMIVDHFVPDATYKFPKASNGRSFQYKWLAKYPWLRYSEKADGGFCIACVLFSHSSNFRSDPGVLVNTPLTDFKRALEKLNYHSERVYHKTATVKMDAFIKVMTGKKQNIQSQLDMISVQPKLPRIVRRSNQLLKL